MSNYAREIAVCNELVEEASEIALSIYSREFTVDEKANKDPVTEADRQLNRLIVERLRAEFPADVVIGEESGHGGTVAGARVWFVDPIDGTSDFIRKNGEWSIMIGLVEDGRACAGIVGEPALGSVYWAAAGEGCFRRRGGSVERVFAARHSDPSTATAVLSRSHPDPDTERVLAALGVTKRFQHGSVGCKVARIADQAADFYFNFSGACHMWDVAGPDIVLREAGGVVAGLDGAPIQYSGVDTRVRAPFVATTQQLLPAVLSRLGELSRDR